MIIETRDFGKLEIDEQEILNFVSPIYGYEGLGKYILLSDDEVGPGIMWLQSVENPLICFILVDPDEFGLDYYPELPQDVYGLLSIKDEMALRLIAVVPDSYNDTTVNLKSPIVINPKEKTAAQVILDADYSIREPLFDSQEAG